MSQPYIGEIKAVGYNFVPSGWSACDGQAIAVGQHQALYSLVGNQFGGDQAYFNLPDLKGRTPVGQGSSNGQTYVVGSKAGQDHVTLSQSQMPGHTHKIEATDDAADSKFLYQQAETENAFAKATFDYYKNATPNLSLKPDMIPTVGAGQAHFNVQPSLAIMFVIAMTGIYPSRN